MNTWGLLVVDDHPVYREALTEKLSLDFASYPVTVKSVGCAQAALEVLTQQARRWVVVLDVQMPGLSGLAGVKAFKAMPGVAHVVSLSGLDEKLWEPRCVQAGASLFLSKNNTSQHIFHKLAQIMQGGENALGLLQAAPPTENAAEFRLTERQKEVLLLIAQGHPNKIIAGLLEISEQTVKIHIHQIFKALRVFNRMQAVLKAQKFSLI